MKTSCFEANHLVQLCHYRGIPRPRPPSKWAGASLYNRVMKDDCLFCSIANGPTDKLIWQNQVAVAFKDIHPKAPVHLLIVPKQHYDRLDDLQDEALSGQLLQAVRQVAEQEGLKGAYRVGINNGPQAGQIIEHLHLHLLGGWDRPQSD